MAFLSLLKSLSNTASLAAANPVPIDPAILARGVTAIAQALAEAQGTPTGESPSSPGPEEAPGKPVSGDHHRVASP
jgi:hypothetical protein